MFTEVDTKIKIKKLNELCNCLQDSATVCRVWDKKNKKLSELCKCLQDSATVYRVWDKKK